MNTNGHRSEDTPRNERRKEGTEGFHLQQSPSATGGSKERTQGLLIHLENSSKDRSIFLQTAETLEDVRQGIFRELPSLSSSKLVLQVFALPRSVQGRVPIQGPVSHHSELYATVYLFKH